ncbi:hypothetical protein, partial [Streptomyces prunicolor]|uniref:hypothetical protein n=1 Tax=Streptomyces prunicolor TaxID=67348 RepID=UPI0034743BDC
MLERPRDGSATWAGTDAAGITGHPAPVSATALERAGMDHEPAAADETGAGRGGTAQPAAYPAPTRPTVTTRTASPR